jgi:putative transposase
MRELAGQYPRYGYRKIRIFLERRDHAMSPERAYRLWRPAGLPATGPNHVWAYDFVSDTCADGASVKCLTVVDEFTRECLAIDVARSIRSSRVTEVLTQLVSVHGAPRYREMDPSSSRRRSCGGCRRRASRRRSSIRGSRGRTARTSRSMASSATSA